MTDQQTLTRLGDMPGDFSSPNWDNDYIPTAQEWNNCFSQKVDGSHFGAVSSAVKEQGQNISTLSTEMTGKVDSINGTATSLSVDAASTLAQVQAGAIVADAHLLRRHGARFDGTTDDSPAFNSIIQAATTPAGYDRPTIAFILPAATILLKSPIVSGNHNISIRGQGAQNTVLLADRSNTGGIWQHGSTAAPSAGYVEISGVMLTDLGGAANAATAINFHFDGTTIPTFRINETSIRDFARGIYLENPPRDVNVSNLTIYGPDFTVQPEAGITVTSTAVGKNIFTTSWTSCNIFNYTYGWKFSGGGMVEGHRFWCCTAYNGWGMLQADMNPTGIDGVTNYQAVVWDFSSCDWQGYGYALDLKNCRGVRVRGGFFTFNERTLSGSSINPPWGSRTAAAKNTMFAFYNCTDILIEGAQFDIPVPGSFTDCAIATFDNRCTNARLRHNAILAYSSLLFGFELGEPGTTALPANTIKILHNEWLHWVGGDKVADHGSSQIDLPWIEDNWLGSQDDSGFITIQKQAQITLSASSVNGQPCSRARINFPLRRYGVNLFRGGVPTVTISAQQGAQLLSAAIQLGPSDNSGFDVISSTAMTGSVLTINYTAQGW